MKSFCETAVASKYSSKSLTDSTDRGSSSTCSDSGSRDSKHNKASLWSNFFASAFLIFETHSESSITENKESHSRNNGWTSAMRKAVTSGSMRRIHERVLGSSKKAINIRRDDLEADTLSCHWNVIRHIPLDLIDPSLAIGFYCRDRDDFNDFCFRAPKLADESNGAPLFTVTQTHSFPRPVNHSDALGDNGAVENEEFIFCTAHERCRWKCTRR